MQRRDFIKVTTGLAGTMIVPRLGFAQNSPCPPPSIWVDSGAPLAKECRPPTSGGTLGSLIGALDVNQWGRLEVTWPGGSSPFWKMTNASESIFGYAHNGHYDPVRKKMFFVGCGYKDAGYVVYDETANSWTSRQLSQQIIHIWDHSSYDPARGLLYFFSQLGTVGYQINVDTGAVSSIAAPWSAEIDTFPSEYWPGSTDSILAGRHANGGVTFRRRPYGGAWSDFATAAWDGGLHTMMSYDHVRNVMYFGGGQSSPTAFYQLSASGTVTKLANSIANIEVSRSVGLCDPVTGDFVLRQTGGGSPQMVKYSPGNGWSTVSTTVPSFLAGNRSCFGVALKGHASGRGVFMSVAASDSSGAGAQVWLYRHS